MGKSESRVAITQPYVPLYRVPLWEKVVENLAEASVEARVFFGGDREQDAEREKRGDSATAPWAERVPVRTLRLPGLQAKGIHRSIPPAWRDALLVTEMQVSNVNAWSRMLTGRSYVTLGHGTSLTTSSGISDRIEGFLNRHATHALTYTDAGRAHLTAVQGVDPDRVTTFRNSVDTIHVGNALSALTAAEVSRFNDEYSISAQSRLVLYVGALRKEKGIELLADAARIVFSHDERSHLVVVGDGDCRELLERLRDETGRVTLLGHSQIDQFAPAARQALFLVCPGRVGLLAVDALAMRKPILTTPQAEHAPEVEYLAVGTDLLVSDSGDAHSFARSWLSLLDDPPAATTTQPPDVTDSAERISEAILLALRNSK